MKKLILLLSFIAFAFVENEQVKNASFEQKTAPESLLPMNWNVNPVEGYTAVLTDEVKHSGEYSLKMVGNPTGPSKYMNVIQNVAVNYKHIKRIKITAYIKTADLKGNVAMWCQLRDGNNKMIGFENSGTQGLSITGTTEWQKYAMNLVVNSDVKNLYFGAYTAGSGTVWFDDFAIEELPEITDEPTAEVLKFNKEFTDIVKKSSIYTDSLDWPKIEEDLKYLAKGLKTTEDATTLNSYVLSKLMKAGDKHSFVQNKIAAQNYAAGNTVAVKAIGSLLDGGIGYLSIPAYGSINKEVGEDFAGSIQKLIKDLDQTNNIKGWVVDLRTNGGGNMYPMISGLGPLLDVGNLGYFVKGESRSPWKNTKNGMGVKVKNPYKVKARNPKIAVLIGPGTGSSGEMTAIAFIGQQNTKFFGEPTAGYVTANQMFNLSDGSDLLLASSYVADRNQKKYLDRIFPDVVVKPINGKDNALLAATTWLAEK